jgi:peptide/nickel transport system permease protein
MTSLTPAPGEAQLPLRSRPKAPATLVFAVRKVAAALTTVVIAAFLIFTALALTPGDPVDQVVGTRATEAQREAARHALGLDKAFPIRFLDWIGDALHGQLGTSITYRQEVSSLIAPRVATTLWLVLLAALLILVLGVALGAFGGISRRWRPVVSAVVGVGLSVPAYVSATVLIGVFAVKLGWFPTYGAGSGLVDRVRHLTLPAIALSLGWIAYVAQMTMASVREEGGKEHVTTAVGRGLSRSLVFRRHIMRNAALPVMTASGLTVAGLVAGTVVVETSFGIDGIGSLLVKSVLNKDYPVVMAVSVLIVLVFVVVTTALDLLQAVLDPRVRQGGGRR